MSMQKCYREQYKMKQVINQIRILADNLDELRVEIDALKNDENNISKNLWEQPKYVKNVFDRIKKYMKKAVGMKLIKNGQDSIDHHEVFPFSYIFRVGRKDKWQTRSKLKSMKNEYSQTDKEALYEQLIGSCVVKSSRSSEYANSAESIQRYSIPFKRGNAKQRYDKIVFPRKRLTLAPQSSKISCELDLQIKNSVPFSSTSKSNNTYPSPWTSLLNENNKQFTSTSTQTSPPKVKRKCRCHDSRLKQSHLRFSKIKNAVITKRIIRQPNNDAFTICRRIHQVEDYPYSSDQFYDEYLCNKNGRNKATETERFKKVPITENDIVFENGNSEEYQESSVSSISVDMEVNVSNNSDKIDETPQRRKPRTYVIRKTSHNQSNWFNQYERSIVYVGQTSDLTLSAHSFSNLNLCQ